MSTEYLNKYHVKCRFCGVDMLHDKPNYTKDCKGCDYTIPIRILEKGKNDKRRLS